MEDLRKQPLLSYFPFSFFVLGCLFALSLSHIHNFQVDTNERDSFLGKLNAQYRTKRSTDSTDSLNVEGGEKCLQQQSDFLQDIRKDIQNSIRLEETHVFTNESNYNLALAWASSNNDGKMIVLTSGTEGVPNSNVWRTIDHGRHWELWNDKVDNKVFKNIKRNPFNPSKLYLLSDEKFMYISIDGGEKWRYIELPDTLLSLEFHTDATYEDFITVGITPDKLLVTYDNFQTPPKQIKEKVHSVKWGTLAANTAQFIYAGTRELITSIFDLLGPIMMDLERYDRKKDKWETILKKVVVFDVQGKFMYASVFKSDHPSLMEDERLMMISSDGGTTWNEAQLPTVTGDRFFSVLDMSEGLIFMHVDNPGDTGHGTLYTSASNGIVYSESLENHLFPNYNTVHDFYKLESIRGVYIASQMSPDKSIHTVVTYNRGGEWKNVSRPVGVKCENDEKEGCFLQIHNAYSLHRGINAAMPHSQESAVGIFLVHALVASNLQTTQPDVFLSTDGGYNFKKVLTGPHAYEIADSGGLLLAVPITTKYPNTIKFSTDEGECWHTYKFTDDEIKFTGIVTEPGSKSMTVSLWGYHKDTKKWTVNTIDFAKVVTRQCVMKDYEDWMPHATLSKTPGHEGCLLGKKETFHKVKPTSWCQNGYQFEKSRSEETCTCTEEDYECDYGFHRLPGSTECVRQAEIKAEQLDICKDGFMEVLDSVGYRLIPGDNCDVANGFKPNSEMKKMDVICSPGDKTVITHNEKGPMKSTGSSGLVITAIILVIAFVVAIIGAFFAYKLILLRRHKQVYRYSMLNQNDGDGVGDSDLDQALGIHDDLYRVDSDEEIEQENKSPQRAPARNGAVPARGGTSYSNPFEKPNLKGYHDDSDDDMLG